MNLIKLISLSKHHTNLCNKFEWYSEWHKHPYHKHIHYITFSIFVLATVIIVYNSYFFKPGFIQAKNVEKVDVAVEEKSEENKKEKDNEKIKEEEIDQEKNKNIEEITAPKDEIINIEKIADFINEKAENIEKIEIITNETVIIKNDEQILNLNELIESIEKNPEIPVEEDATVDDSEEQNADPAEETETPPIEEEITEETPPLAVEATSTEEPLIEELLAIEVEEPTEETPPLTEEPVIIPVIPVLETATVLNVTSPARNNKYRTGPISIHIIFNKPVEVSGSPTLSIATGDPSETLINYENGSGTDTLIFVYNIASSNSSSDLDYNSTDSLLLNGGSIKDSDGNDASIVLPIPSSTHSLGGNKDIKIDTVLKKPNIVPTD